jgi:beta-xylosidase
MKKFNLSILLLFIVCFVHTQTVKNPLIFADVPDMSMVRVGNIYYMSSTTMHMSPGVPIMKSEDLMNWQIVNYAYDTLANSDAMNLTDGKNAYGRGSWASCIRYHNEKFYVSTFSHTTGKTCIYITDDIENGPWETHTFTPALHDHTLWFDDDGRVYMIYGNGKLFITELEPDFSGMKPGTNRVLIENASAPAGNDMALEAEGSQLFRHEGKYYLFNIAWPRGGMRTQIVHRADSLNGKWEGRQAFQHAGIAQGGMIETPGGAWYAYLFRDYGAVGRIPYLLPVSWEDGFPQIGVGAKEAEKSALSGHKGLMPGIVNSDEFNREAGSRALPPVWQWNHNPDNALWKVENGYLRLTTGRLDSRFESARNTLTQRTIGPVCSGTVKMDVSGMKDGDFAGLCLLQKHYGQTGIKVSGNRKFIYMINASSGKPVEQAEIPFSQKTVYFKVECDFREKTDLAFFYYSMDGVKWQSAGQPLQMSYTLDHFTGYRFGLYNYATKNTGGYADFDYFRISGEITGSRTKEAGSAPHLAKSGTATQLIVNNKPFLILGGELGNSSAASVEDIERIFPKLQRMGLNTVLVPAYWDLIEPSEGVYDFSLVDKAVQQARANHLKVIFLWFGAWKNSMSCYAPLWFKKDYEKYPRAYTKAGKPLEIAGSFSENVYQADNRAFSQLMKHIASVDQAENTVIMVQIENETGMIEDARDYSAEANRLFNEAVPEALLHYLSRHKHTLHPQMLEKWGKQGFKTKGNWQEVFGADLYTDEIFMAWYYACYIEKLAQTARAVHNIPLYVNAAMNSRGRKPGEYPSAGPLAHLIDVWHCGAPTIDLLAPDLYDKGFTDWVAKYRLHNNPLFIPEIRLANSNGVQAFYVFGEHDAIGFCPFSIESGSDSAHAPLVKSYARLKELMPLLAEHQGKNTMNGLYFDKENPQRIIYRDDLKITCRHFFTLPWDPRATDGSEWPEGGGIILRLAEDEYIVAGSGIVVEFEKTDENNVVDAKELGEDGFASTGNNKREERRWNGSSRCGIGSVDEIAIKEDGAFGYIRRLNGDQTHQGRHVRIGVDDFSILHVKLYDYK